MKLKILTCLIGLLALAPSSCGRSELVIDWEVFRSGTSAQVKAEISQLPEDVGLEAKDEHGFTPLMLAAAANSNPEVIKVLLQAGAEIETRTNSGWTPLMWAAGSNSNQVITILLKAGAEVNGAPAYGGFTPLMVAALIRGTSPANSDLEIITTLLKAGANAKAKDSSGETALDFAKQNKNIYKTEAYWELNDAFHNQD